VSSVRGADHHKIDYLSSDRLTERVDQSILHDA
jgi:hypothetical protein